MVARSEAVPFQGFKALGADSLSPSKKKPAGHDGESALRRLGRSRAVHEAALLRVDEVRQDADAVAFDDLRRQVGDAFRGDHHRFFPLILIHPRDRFL